MGVALKAVKSELLLAERGHECAGSFRAAAVLDVTNGSALHREMLD